MDALNKTLIEIIAQTYVDGEPRGLQVFLLNADDNLFLNSIAYCVNIIKDMVASKSTPTMSYVYLEHNFIFNKPIVLDDNEFETKINDILSALSLIHI